MTFHPLTYLLARRFKNRIFAGLRKLRQPKVLIGAILFVGYFGWIITAQFLFDEDGRGVSTPFRTEMVVEAIAPLGMVVLSLMGWVISGWKKTHPLWFTRGDVELLFPLPLSRRQLIAYSLAHTQLGLFFSALFLTLFISRSTTLAMFLGWYLFVNVGHLHRVGASFAQGTPRQAGLIRLGFAWAPAILIAGGVGVGLAAASVDVPRLLSVEVLDELERIARTPILYAALSPFRVLATLVLAGPASLEYVPALLGGLGLLAAHVGWVFLQESSFEEASLRGAEARAARIEALKRGEAFSLRRRSRGPVTRQPFRLRPLGSPVVAFVWKGVIAAGRGYTRRNVALGVFACFVLGLALRYAAGELAVPHAGKVGLAVGGWIAVTMYMFILFRPSQEGIGLVESMAVLKSLPLRGRTIFAGSVLAEVIPFTVLYLLLGCALAGYLRGDLGSHPLLELAGGAMALVSVTMLIALGSAGRLATVLWLPFTAKQQVGMEAMGHNMLIFLVRIISLGFLLVAPGIAVVLTVLLFRGTAAAPVLAMAVGCAAILGEVIALVLLGGWLLERFDIVAER